jgi:hypothetical protein
MRINPMKRYFWIRSRLFLRQARWGFGLIAAWFLLGTILFHFAEVLNARDAILNACIWEKAPAIFGTCIPSGASVSFFDVFPGGVATLRRDCAATEPRFEIDSESFAKVYCKIGASSTPAK